MKPESGMNKVVGIDPGPFRSAYVVWDGSSILAHGICDNILFLRLMKNDYAVNGYTHVIEMVQSYGMPVGREIFETVLVVGRLLEIFNDYAPHLVFRQDIKLYFCRSMRAKDANIRQVLIDRFGPQGTKKKPGPLYGIRGDEWSALAVAVYYSEAVFCK